MISATVDKKKSEEGSKSGNELGTHMITRTDLADVIQLAGAPDATTHSLFQSVKQELVEWVTCERDTRERHQ